MNNLRNLALNARVIPRPDWRKLTITRLERVKKEGSDFYSWHVPVTAAGATSQIEVAHQFPAARKYMPLDWLEICNNDVVDLTLAINGGDAFPVPAGTIRPVSKGGIWQVAVTNNDAVANSTLHMIIVTLRREPITQDKWLREGI